MIMCYTTNGANTKNSLVKDFESIHKLFIEKNNQLIEKNEQLMWYNNLIKNLIKCTKNHKKDLYHTNRQFLMEFNNIINEAVKEIETN